MDQIQRIEQMERILDQGTIVLAKLEEALRDYAAVQSDLQQLYQYYFGPLWRQDLRDDQADRIPRELKRGVLSQDAVYDLFQNNELALQEMRSLCGSPRLRP